MATSFGKTQAQLARYAYERLVYTVGPFSLLAGTNPVFSASKWNAGNATWQARLEMIQGTQNDQVQLLWTADPQNQTNALNQGYTAALPAGVRQQEMLLAGVNSMQVQVANTSGATINNFQTNYAVAMKRLTAADKLLAKEAGLAGNAYELSTQEVQALAELNLVKTDAQGSAVVTKSGRAQLDELVAKGTQPVGLERIMAGLWANRDLGSPADLFYPQASAADNPFATYQANMGGGDPTKGRFLVLTEIAMPGGPDATLTVDRDGQLGYMMLNGAAFAQADDAPWKVWVPAVDYLTFHVTTTGAPANVPVRLRVMALEMSEVLAVLFGLAAPAQVHGKTWAKAIAGVV